MKKSGKKFEIEGDEEPPPAHVLRRSQVLKIIDSKPSERYKELKDFIELERCSRNENSLNEAKKQVEKKREESEYVLRQSEEEIEKLWRQENKTGIDFTKWKELILQRDPKTIKEEVQSLTKYLGLFSQCQEKYDELFKLRENRMNAQKKMAAAQNLLSQAQKEMNKASNEMIDILEKAKSFLQVNHSENKCPLCEQEIDTGALRNRIDQRLQDMNRQVKLKTEFEKTKKEFENKDHLYISGINNFVEKTRNLIDFFNEKNLAKIIIEIDPLSEKFWEQYAEQGTESFSKDDSKIVYKNLSQYTENLKSREEYWANNLRQLISIKETHEKIEKNKKALVKLKTQEGKLKRLQEILENERKVLLKTILSGISSAVESLYKRIHPGEGYGEINFLLNPKRKASLFIKGEYCGYDEIPPQAYFSESHLDTLGICVKIALAKRYSAGDSILVLDDVVTSVDQVHLERFMEMLHEETRHFSQIIITTHYRPWFENYRYNKLPSGQVQLIELSHWSIEQGIRHRKSKIELDHLKELYSKESFDRQAVAAKAGVVLECLLDHLTLIYKCKLPRKPQSSYTIGDFINAIDKKLRSALEVKNEKEDQSVELTKFLSELSSMNNIRNKVGSHFTALGSNFLESDIKKMVDNTIGLAEALICDRCGQLPNNDKSGSGWRCSCGKTELFPLQRPR